MPLLKHELKNDILTIVLDDPDSLNAFSPEMARAFNEVLSQNKTKALFVTASGSMFCSGGNLAYYAKLKSAEAGLVINKEISDILKALSEAPIVKACYVNGPVYGGGIELLSCFDYIVAHPAALFGLWQRRIGLTLGWGSEERLAQRLGRKTLKKWLLSTETLSSFSACEIGLVDKVQLPESGRVGALQWLARCLEWGDQSLDLIASSHSQAILDFEKLWSGERHRKALQPYQ